MHIIICVKSLGSISLFGMSLLQCTTHAIATATGYYHIYYPAHMHKGSDQSYLSVCSLIKTLDLEFYIGTLHVSSYLSKIAKKNCLSASYPIDAGYKH